MVVNGDSLTAAIGKLDNRAHSTLQNLTADDHTQYSLVAGTRAFTGKVRGVSTAGADPATTLVTKDYVDANSVTQTYVNTNFVFKTGNVNENVTGQKTFTAVAHFNANFTVGSSALITNLNADFLDGLSSTDFVRATGSVNQTVTGNKDFSSRVGCTAIITDPGTTGLATLNRENGIAARYHATAPGGTTISDEYNVSSVVVISAGRYRVTFKRQIQANATIVSSQLADFDTANFGLSLLGYRFNNGNFADIVENDPNGAVSPRTDGMIAVGVS